MNPNKPTLLVLTSTFPRWENDSEPRFVFDLCTRLTSTFEVIVLAPHAPNALANEQYNNLNIYRYHYAPTSWETLAYEGGITANLKKQRWKLLLLPGFFIAQWWAIRRLLKQYPVDIIHAHWLIPQGLVAAIALLNFNKRPKLVCTSHGGDLFGLQGKLGLALKRWVVSQSQRITVVSQAMLEPLQALSTVNSPHTYVIPMGTDLEHTFIPNPTIDRDELHLLFVGRLVEKKGLVYLLQALKELTTFYPNLKLSIIGSGPLQSELENLVNQLQITEQVDFLGRLNHSELVSYYQKATMAVFPFIQAKDGDMEGLGLVMIEAMGCGCPVIASNLLAVHDVIKHHETGMLVTPNHTSELTKTIQLLLEQPAKRSQLAKQALEHIKKHFDWHSITAQYAEALTATPYSNSTGGLVHDH